MRAKVLIVGGGFAGASTAYFLSQAGIGDIVLVDKESHFGIHSSGRNAGLGRQIVPELMAYTSAGMSFLRNTNLGTGPLLTVSGSVLLAKTSTGLQEIMDCANQWNVTYKALCAQEIYDRWSMLSKSIIHGGLYIPDDGMINIQALLSGFLNNAEHHGVTLQTSCEVLGCKQQGKPWILETSQGDITTDIIVAASGAWNRSLGDSIGVMTPVMTSFRRHLFVTHPLPVTKRVEPFLWHVDDHFYIRQYNDDTCLISACDATEMEPQSFVEDSNALMKLKKQLNHVAPSLATYEIDRQWACLRTFTEDNIPLVDWDNGANNLFWVAGLGGHGATGCSVIGEQAAVAIAKKILD